MRGAEGRLTLSVPSSSWYSRYYCAKHVSHCRWSLMSCWLGSGPAHSVPGFTHLRHCGWRSKSVSSLGQPLSWRRDRLQAQLQAMAAESEVAHYYGKGAASYQCSILDKDGPQLMGPAIEHFVQDVSAQLRLMPQPHSLLDLGSATGQPGFNLARNFPAAEVTGRHLLSGFLAFWC